ncbi:hypothetical protein CDD82_6181 [Ophiocordyceps australis]|uniref:Major facilitator superfamily (MFS) profile domain-containing protein n=1 Tax=Ophiocordyceps australis TaxID=1399860 RepID=A0A2C5YYT7_9HYPO|nr:hypothetical protein CDD82_6181 [Ophiocordyceps australis]
MRTLERVMHAAIASSVWHVSIFYMAHLQATIAKSLGSIELMPWLSIGFFVGALIAIMPLCHVYARRSVKFIFLGSIVSGLGATTLCSTANSMLTAILACVWAGSSASGSLLGAFYTNVLVAPRHNNISRLSHLQVAWGFGIIIGPLMAAAVRPEAWRTALYIHIILGIPIFISLACLVPSSRPMPLDRQDVLPFDFLGLILSAACVVLFTLATNWASVAYSFASWQVIVLYWLSGVCLIAFFYQQANCIGIRLHARLLPELPWATKQFYVLWALVALSAIVAYVPLFYLAVYLQLVRGQSQFYSSLVSLAFNLSQGLGGTLLLCLLPF